MGSSTAAGYLFPVEGDKPAHADMPWDDFRDEYSEVKVSTMRRKAAEAVESRLDICTKIARPRTLRQMAESGPLHQLQTKLLSGAAGRLRKGRKNHAGVSSHTVQGYMRTLLAAQLGTAEQENPRQRARRGSAIHESDDMKGRPLVGEEFDRMVLVVPKIVEDKRPPPGSSCCVG